MEWHDWFFRLMLAGWSDEQIAKAYGTTPLRVHTLIVLDV